MLIYSYRNTNIAGGQASLEASPGQGRPRHTGHPRHTGRPRNRRNAQKSGPRAEDPGSSKTDILYSTVRLCNSTGTSPVPYAPAEKISLVVQGLVNGVP